MMNLMLRFSLVIIFALSASLPLSGFADPNLEPNKDSSKAGRSVDEENCVEGACNNHSYQGDGTLEEPDLTKAEALSNGSSSRKSRTGSGEGTNQ